MNTPMPLHASIRKKIKILDYEIGQTGIEIGYIYEGIEKIVTHDPEETCKLLKQTFIINDFCGYGKHDDLVLEVVTELNSCDHNGEHVQQQFVQHLFWEDFLFQFNLSQYDALSIITEYEHAKQLKEWFNGLVDKAKNEYKLNSAHSHLINNGFLS